jgi:hypothetical protein
VFDASPRVENPLLIALRGDKLLHDEALQIFYLIKRVVMKLHHERFVGQPMPTSVKTLGYVRNLNIKHISFHEDTASHHILEGAALLKLLPNVDDLQYEELAGRTGQADGGDFLAQQTSH